MVSKKKPGGTRAKKAAPGGSGSPLIAKPLPEPVPVVLLPHGFALDPTCSRCYATLSHYMRALGICGDCLAVSQEDVRSIPGARYGR